jgi:hypothetical protein
LPAAQLAHVADEVDPAAVDFPAAHDPQLADLIAE